MSHLRCILLVGNYFCHNFFSIREQAYGLTGSSDLLMMPSMMNANTDPIRFVGGWRKNPPAGDHTLLATMYERLPREVCDEGVMTRLVRYETLAHSGERVEFVGVEVQPGRPVANGLMCWELSPGFWRGWRGESEGIAPAWEEEIRWLWREAERETGWVFGEFSACWPDEWGDLDHAAQPFYLTGCAPLVPGKSAPDQVELVEHDPAWRDRFEGFARWLVCELGPQIGLRIEHFGSTAIPGIPAKPIIDVLVEIPSFEEAKPVVLPRLLGPEWEYWWYADKITLIRREGLLGHRTHHVHLAPKGHEVWQGIAFRDYLRKHEADARRYAELKEKLAGAYAHDREEYTQQKSDFVREIIRRAGESKTEAATTLPDMNGK